LSSVHGARDAHVPLDVELWEDVFIVDGCFCDVTDCGLFNNVGHLEPLNCLVLWACSGAVITPDKFVVPTTVLVTAVVSPLLGNCGRRRRGGGGGVSEKKEVLDGVADDGGGDCAQWES
jgi:hypothetical protein